MRMAARREHGRAGGAGHLAHRPLGCGAGPRGCATTTRSGGVRGHVGNQAAAVGIGEDRAGPPTSRPTPATTTSEAIGESAASARAFIGPTRTQVPVESLKSSATRPSNHSPAAGRSRSTKATASLDAVVALVVERGGCRLGRPPVAGRDVRAGDADLEPAGRRHQLQDGARDGHPDVAGMLNVKVAVGRHGRRLGRSPGRHQRDVPRGCASVAIDLSSANRWLERLAPA